MEKLLMGNHMVKAVVSTTDTETAAQKEAVLKEAVVEETDTTMIGMSLTIGTHTDTPTIQDGMMKKKTAGLIGMR